MNAAAFNLLGLRLRLLLARIGWGAGLAALLCLIGAIVLLWLVPHLRAQGAVQQIELARAQAALLVAATKPAAEPLSLVDQRLEKFYEVLGERRYAEQQIKTLFAVAAKTGLNLSQGEYKAGFDKNSDTHTYQILLPVKGAYPAIRQFCEKTLMVIPFASLDEMNFKREAIGSDVLDAKLRFTLYLAGGPAAQEMAKVQR
ncbi:hypothetical protein RCH09_002661 [Actimicrobium sp. GrIS 1.19]|uniref:hypothetical protein n=1 Tax=Actimicrobium sp. GrIS 1.19 TaxID=3071708 RepID=UPI002DF98C3B|nr:hypothetical protein [Actimicrobium sp. GrIS 1.19]